MRFKTSLPLIAIAMTLAAPAFAEDKADAEITLKDHAYVPAEITVPAGKAFTLKVRNEDATAEEFESHALRIEKVIAGGKESVIHIHALKPGKYEFVGEYNEDTAKGVIIAQ